ncbi:aquaporin [Hymenobacter busanensis]|uniref:Aquaporin n=1 Tax=Hymenobacter busanensis TaxID=2607656 RepID=A0A7L4ZW41_9BACT|nr:aquaporin [Hymenobacter busanensis]KAA9339162.1 aquaporin [Hymenobacter busanensis]QHJ07076.1 aquaporin [Hymenobacter busanensis]
MPAEPARPAAGWRPVLLAEALGTFILLFCGTGAVVVNAVAGGVVGHGGIAATFGLVVLSLIYAFGDVSGAHLNPAVTLAFAAAGRMPFRWVLPYAAAQAVGAFAASIALRLLFPLSSTLGGTRPAGPVFQSFGMEFLLTLLLMLVVLRVSEGAREKGLTAGIAVGAFVGLEALFAGPISGASMNPIRSLAPAAVAGQWQHLWLYVVAPTLGALAAVPLARALRTP